MKPPFSHNPFSLLCEKEGKNVDFDKKFPIMFERNKFLIVYKWEKCNKARCNTTNTKVIFYFMNVK